MSSTTPDIDPSTITPPRLSKRDPFAMGAALVPWLVGLRWAIIVLLSLALPASARWLGLPVRWEIALPTLGALVAVNLLFRTRRVQASSSTGSRIAASVLFDMVAIALVLGASGGPANPFSSLLFVYVALAASLFPVRLTYVLASFAACIFGALFFFPQPAECPGCATRGDVHDGAFSSHLHGMWVAFALGAALIVYFLTRVRRTLEEQGRALDALQRRADESAKFAAIGTLAAGAAHELATPLGTITILAGELDGTLASQTSRSIVLQVDRCRDVLRRMQPGAHREAQMGDTSLGNTVTSAVETWRAAHPGTDVVVRRAEDVAVSVSPGDLEAALSVLLDNALYASEKAHTTDPIVVEAGRTPEGLCMSVADRGIGVPEAIASRVGEPFLTTKEPGEGMGLGLYLVRTLIEQAGGRLEITANAPSGTRVALYLAGIGAR